MNVDEMVGQARDAITIKRVFGEPYERNGVTIIPAAKVQGGGGGGSGTQGEQEGSGGGFGVNARPVGAYVIKDGVVSWQPAFDLNRAILGGQILAAIGLLSVRSIVRARSRRKAREARARARAA